MRLREIAHIAIEADRAELEHQGYVIVKHDEINRLKGDLDRERWIKE